jgi:hypothetical protein
MARRLPRSTTNTYVAVRLQIDDLRRIEGILQNAGAIELRLVSPEWEAFGVEDLRQAVGGVDRLEALSIHANIDTEKALGLHISTRGPVELTATGIDDISVAGAFTQIDELLSSRQVAPGLAYVPQLALSILPGAFGAIADHLYAAAISSYVILNEEPKATWWERNGDALVVTVVGGLIVGLILFGLTQLLR